MVQRLGEPGTRLAEQVEPLFLALELTRGSGEFASAPWLLARATVTSRANELPTAEIEVNLADPEQFNPSFAGRGVYDWLIRGPDQRLLHPDSDLLGGRRLRVGTSRTGGPAENWPLFQGYIEKVEFSWSGSRTRQGRGLRLYAVSDLVAADREPSQQMYGQWRRHWKSEAALRASGKPGPGSNACARIGVPLVFNPHGRPNCDPAPLTFADTTKVWVPCDVDRPDAIPFTLAKALRYIQWAALQPAPPGIEGTGRTRYDVFYESADDGIQALADAWTTLKLRHANLTELLAGGVNGRTIVGAPPDAGGGDFNRAALLRALPSLACEGMSTLEAFAYLCDRGGLMLHSYHAAHAGEVRTFVAFTVRGHTRSYVPSAGEPTQEEEGGLVGEQDGPAQPDPTGAVSRTVNVWVLTDNWDPTGVPEINLVRLTQATEGAILLDESARRQTVRAIGDPPLYEVTVPLLPGWKPDAWWDVDPNNAQAVNAAIARTLTPPWEQRHLSTGDINEHYRIGRYWVLNEDGAFLAAAYRRAKGPWSQAKDWDPYPFHGAAGIEGLRDLSTRGDRGWSIRRRRFLPPIAVDADKPGSDALTLGLVLLVSFAGDNGPWYTNICELRLEHDRCAIMVTNPDLRLIRGYSPTAGLSADNWVTAYIRGLLRVWLATVIEGDDALFGYARAGIGGPVTQWSECLDRRGQYRAELRDQGFNSFWAGGFRQPANRDDTGELDALCARVRNEAEIRRPTGQFVVPYLLRPADYTPWPNYQVGDEIGEIQTDDAFSTVALTSGPPSRRRGPRVAGLVWRYGVDPADVSTAVILEDGTYDVNDVAGPPVRKKEEG